jgi:hypothetical protein
MAIVTAMPFMLGFMGSEGGPAFYIGVISITSIFALEMGISVKDYGMAGLEMVFPLFIMALMGVAFVLGVLTGNEEARKWERPLGER